MALWKDPTKDPSMPGSDGAAALAAEPAMRSVATPVPTVFFRGANPRDAPSARPRPPWAARKNR